MHNKQVCNQKQISLKLKERKKFQVYEELTIKRFSDNVLGKPRKTSSSTDSSSRPSTPLTFE
uniref:Uncharacterized protein n=1 Tax=Romanomermis culicivorax TaxID=13658 RepID=A0A915K411_ROMCU